MSRVAAAGTVLLALSLVGYAVAVVSGGYPGQSFTLTGAMVGIALVAVGSGNGGPG